MKVLIVGLGLMGGAYAYRLKNKGYNVYAYDINQEAIEIAKGKNYIDDGSTNILDYIEKADMIILCIYPQMIIEFLKENAKYFKPTQIITDICGVKSSFVEEATKLALPATYVSHHPMAGREKSGVEYSNEVKFEEANFIITALDDSNNVAIDVLKKMGEDLGFKRITVIDPKNHDRLIGFTSQLAHAIAVSLVNSDDNPNETKKFIGDSYRDLTRIAMINDNLWCELFLENKDFLFEHIKRFEFELDILKQALANDDKETLKKLFKSSTKTRKEMEK
jgi:prephenate dehydrogenase